MTDEQSSVTDNLDGPSKKSQELKRKLQETAATATPEDLKIVAEFLRSGAGSRRMVVTPAAAAIIVLHHNPLNRKLSFKKIEGLVHVIISGDWRATHHQGAAVTSNGHLGDAQHRLISCALAGVSIGLLVTSDVPFDDILDVVDTGTTRTPGQALKMRGWDRGEDAAPLAARLAAYIHQRTHGVKPQLPGLIVQRFARDNAKLLEDALSIGEKSKKDVSEPCLSAQDASMIASVLLFDGWDSTQAAGFLFEVQNGRAPYDNAPTLPLERMLEAHNKLNNHKGKMTPMERVALSVKCASLFQDRVGV
jgi:hypothetical protein